MHPRLAKARRRPFTRVKPAAPPRPRIRELTRRVDETPADYARRLRAELHLAPDQIAVRAKLPLIAVLPLCDMELFVSGHAQRRFVERVGSPPQLAQHVLERSVFRAQPPNWWTGSRNHNPYMWAIFRRPGLEIAFPLVLNHSGLTATTCLARRA